MKTLKCSLAAKTAAVILFAFCLAAAGISLLAVLFGYEGGVYTNGTTNFFDSSYAENFARRFGVLQVLGSYESGASADALEKNYGGSDWNFAYTLTAIDESGAETVLSSTMETNQTYGYTNAWDHTMEDTTYRVAVSIKNPMPYHYSEEYAAAQSFHLISSHSTALLVLLCGAILLGVLLFVFLCCAAGHRKGVDLTVITPNWIDRIPFELNAAAAGLLIWMLLSFTVSVGPGIYSFDLFAGILACLALLLSTLIALSVVLSFATRVKLGCWWRNTVAWRLLMWLKRNAQRFCGLLARVYHAVPMIWRTLLVVGGLLVLLLFLGVSSYWGGAGLLFYALLSLAILGAAALAAMQMRQLQAGGEKLAAGNFDAKIDTTRMYWDFKRHAEHLNAVGEGMSIAVEQRMKSERLKTELITNVSHDIKTPLTSIINYVDLLQKEHTADAQAQYLEVLQRQSARLKKLTEDLLEASKASTGNIAASLSHTNVVESLNQALGEYEERLKAGNLCVVSEYEAEELAAMADGRLLWRILDNLLNNVCKYALSGTRVYVMAQRSGNDVLISVKNISRQQLNVNAEELMERFVRGDSARTTEGSGLGLSIARSLTELQHGSFSLTVDGDLFKAEVRLPRCLERRGGMESPPSDVS